MTTAFDKWLARTGGDEPMNDEERIQQIYELAARRNSFAGDEVQWALEYLGYVPDQD